MFRSLKLKIKKRDANIAIIGLGYVGLPLAVNFARKGFNVVGIDTDNDRAKRIAKGTSYILDVSAKDLRLLLKKRLLRATTDFKELKKSDVIIICVPTPLKTKYTPNISFILDAVKMINKFHLRGALIVLESTTYPGTTEEVILPILERGGRVCDRDFYLGFSPERIDPGNKAHDFKETPKVVSGVTKSSAELVELLYKIVVKKVVTVSSPKAAETVKLLENTFRIVNIALINELAMLCQKLKIDIWEVIDAAKTKPFGFMAFYPGPGVGGHCIPKDPLYLYWKAKRLGFPLKFIKLASDVNSGMPAYIISRLKGILKKRNQKLSGSRILVLGVTYKADVKDLRKSPALDIIDLLLKAGAEVSYHDPHIPYLKIDGINLKSIDLSRKSLLQFDCVLITTAHRNLNYRSILSNAKMVFDTRNVFNRPAKNLVKL